MENRRGTSLSVEEASYLHKLYTDTKNPSAYGGIKELHRQVLKDGLHKIGVRRIRKWLQQQDSYTTHKSAIKKFPRNRVVVRGIRHVYQGDLSDVSSLSNFNNGVNWLCCVIDVFSKCLYVQPMKSKTGQSTLKALRIILRDAGKPKLFQTDKGSEFLNKSVQNFLKREGVGFYVTENNSHKAVVVERVQRTLKTRLYRYMTEKNTLRYIDNLQAIVKSINNSYHRSIGTTPSGVNKENEDLVWSKLYGGSWGTNKWTVKPDKLPKFKVGDTVRISKDKALFEKGYYPNWTEEVFKVTELVPRRPIPVYRIEDMLSEAIAGTFYPWEMTKVQKSPDSFYKIEKVLKKKKLRGVRYSLVKWVGYPKKFNSWVKDTDIKSIA